MTKHVLDRDRTPDSSRVKRFAEIERQSAPEGGHPASRLLHRRPQTRNEGNRTEQFLRTERTGIGAV